MKRAATLCLLTIAAGCGASRPVEPPATEPPAIEAWRALWIRLAAQRNEMTPETFVTRTVASPPELRCDARFGACMFGITYRYRVEWIELTEHDQFFVRATADGPWLSVEQLLGDLGGGASSPEHIGRMHRVDKPLVFPSFDEARNAFVARFGHRPKAEVVWRPYGEGPSQQTAPVLEGKTHDCKTEVLQLATGSAREEPERYCFEDDKVAPSGR